MSYKINRTDARLLVDLIDGRIDTDTTDLTLVGKNFTGYGEYFNENFIRLLENFANTASPANPITGQLWYDSSSGRLKVYNETTQNWKSTDTTVVASTLPTDLLEGDLWIDSANQQLKFKLAGYSEPFLVGPIYTQSQGESGWDPVTLIDTFGTPIVVLRLMLGGSCAAIFSKQQFTAANIDDNLRWLQTGFTTTIKAGINISSIYAGFAFNGTAESTSQLIDEFGNTWVPDDFLKVSPSTSLNTTTGRLHVKNDLGLILGDDSDYTIKVEGSAGITHLAQVSGADLRFRIKQGSTVLEAITIDNSELKIGFWNATPTDDVTIGSTADRKNLTVTGNLTVQGDITYLDISTLKVQDKNIQLAVVDDSTGLLSDALLDGAGITIVAADGLDKEFIWKDTAEDGGTWYSSGALDIPAGYSYKINGSSILTSTSLSTSVTTATGLTEIGTLEYLNVDNINLNGSTLTVSGGLTLALGGDLIVSPSIKITGVATPDVSDDPSTVATKEYVDDSYLDRDVWMTLDITGLNNAQIALVIEDLVPAATKNTGVYCYVHCTYYTGTYDYDASDGLTKSFVAVDKNGTENQSVVQDFSFTAQTTQPVTLSVTRSLKRFIINGIGQWIHEADLTSSV